MLIDHTHYRSYLNTLLAEKCAKNPQFSLRAFAGQLNMSPSNLSRILNGKRNLTTKMAAHVSMLLGHSEVERAYFSDLILLEESKNDKVKQSIIERIEKRRSIDHPRTVDLDAFRIISDWYHFALLALTKTKGFKSNPQWIAKRLGISIHEVKLAIERLKNLTLLREEKNNYVAVNHANVTTTHDISSIAIKNYHKQMVGKALEAIEHEAVQDRDISSITVSFKPSQMAKTKKLIKEFRQKMNAELDVEGGEDLYQLNIQFFKLTTKENT